MILHFCRFSFALRFRKSCLLAKKAKSSNFPLSAIAQKSPNSLPFCTAFVACLLHLLLCRKAAKLKVATFSTRSKFLSLAFCFVKSSKSKNQCKRESMKSAKFAVLRKRVSVSFADLAQNKSPKRKDGASKQPHSQQSHSPEAEQNWQLLAN